MASGVFKVFPQNRVHQRRLLLWNAFSERTLEQIVDIPGGGPQGFRPGQGSPASSFFVSPVGSDDDANEPDEGVFSHFSPWKKVRSAGQVVSAQLGGHVSSSTMSAHQMALVPESPPTPTVPSSGSSCMSAKRTRPTAGTDAPGDHLVRAGGCQGRLDGRDK